MAGMERLEIHSRSYFIRWVNAASQHTISWTIKPEKKSVNFGIFKRSKDPQSWPSTPESERQAFVRSDVKLEALRKGLSRNEASTASEQLQSNGLLEVAWLGKCEADQDSVGSYDVPTGQGGMYALVFDNTFSKQVSKTVTAVILTYPTHIPPQTTQHLHPRHPSMASSEQSGQNIIPPRQKTRSPAPTQPDAVYANARSSSQPGNAPSRPTSQPRNTSRPAPTAKHFTGVLLKRRRRRHQGYGKRFFSLDFNTSTLSYYHDRRSLALRGSMPLSLAAVGANETTREISIDSGAEVWHLRAGNQREFRGWRQALEKAASSAFDESTSKSALALQTGSTNSPGTSQDEGKEWARVETLAGEVAGIRDVMRRLYQESDLARGAHYPERGRELNAEPSPTDSNGTDYFKSTEKRPFWKRKTSESPTAGIFKRSVSGSRFGTPLEAGNGLPLNGSHHSLSNGDSLHSQHATILNDLDVVVTKFSSLLSESRSRRVTGPTSALSRHSIESASSVEFFDAHEGGGNDSRLLHIQHDDEGDEEVNESTATEGEEDDKYSTSSSEESSPQRSGQSGSLGDHSVWFPAATPSLSPLPHPAIKRRATVRSPTVLPPSLIAFLRKNVGKDLSTISMPVSANEPTSLLQRAAEQMEYSQLLDTAVKSPANSVERLLYVAAFAVSGLSVNRVKERSIRKPFNPMLGETFELVREDKGFRFLAEKVSHRPVQMACFAESSDWSMTHSPLPTQKFWGKSAELITDGRARVILHDSRECFSWTSTTCFLRNIIAGEKYIEPVSSMTVLNESTGHKAIITFKTKGMFSGRSEDVTVHVVDPQGRDVQPGLVGKWTTSLSFTNPTSEAWSVGKLVDNPSAHYGMTAFAVSMNDISAMEEGKLPPTDSRLREDQRAVENGDLDRAETIKAQLEEGQRLRRKELEEQGSSWTPQWFERIPDTSSPNGEGEDSWRLKRGPDGYWERRTKEDWHDVVNVLKT